MTMPIKNVKFNENYEEVISDRRVTYVLNDIATIKLAKPLDLDNNPDLGVFCTPKNSDDWDSFVGKQVVIAGFSTMVDEEQNTLVHQQTGIQIVPMENYRKKFDLKRTEIINRMLCYEFTNGSTSEPCQVRTNKNRY